MIALIQLPPFSFTKNEKGINSISAAIELFLYYYHRQMPTIKLREHVGQNWENLIMVEWLTIQNNAILGTANPESWICGYDRRSILHLHLRNETLILET